MTRQIVSYTDAIATVIKTNNGIATTRQVLDQISKFRPLTGKTPEATILSELGRSRRFAKIGVGVWALAENKNNFSEVNNISFQKDLDIISEKNNADDKEIVLSTERMHAQIQGMLLEIGNVNGFQTYTPNKNSTFNNKPLKNLSSLEDIPNFTYERIIRAVRYIDVLWFTNDKEPFPVFAWEVENSTNFRDGLIKFTELNFFKTHFYFLAPETKINKFQEEVSRPIFKEIKKSCDFYSMERVKQSYQSTLENEELRIFNYDQKI